MQLQSLIIGALCLVSGLGIFLFPRRKRLAAEARMALRKQQLAAGGSERFFEEARSLDAYPLPATDRKWKIRGALLATLGVVLLILA